MPSSDGRRRRVWRGLMSAVLATGFAAGCAPLPTDESGSLTLVLVDPPTQLLVGDTVRLTAALSGTSMTLNQADVTYTSDQESVIVVGPAGTLNAVGEGIARITAALTRWEGAATVTHDIYVSRGIVIVSLAGTRSTGGTLRFGETLVLRGLRLDPDSLASVTIASRPAEIVGYTPRDAQDPGSLEELRIGIPVAPPAAELLLVHSGGGTAARTLRITQEDVLELEPSPYRVDLGTGPFRAAALTVGFPDVDWIRFTVPAGDWTVRLSLLNGFGLSGAAEANFFLKEPGLADGRYPAWGREQAQFACDTPNRDSGFWSTPREVGVPELLLPLRFDAPLTMDFSALTLPDFIIPYRLSVTAGYDSEIPPDPMEGNDFCFQARPVALGASQDLSFDTSSDHDWFEVVIPGTPGDFQTTDVVETEDNDSFARADTVLPGTRVLGARDDGNDQDVFLVELQAGTLLDLHVLGAGLPDEPLPGRSVRSDMVVDLQLFDGAGNLLARSGLAPSVPDSIRERAVTNDARIRYIVPVTGSYYFTVDGSSLFAGAPDTGPSIYYAADVRVHEAAGVLQVEALAAGAPSRPSLVFVERREGGPNYILARTPRIGGSAASLSVPVHPGPYYLLAYGSGGIAGEYALSLDLAPPGGAP